MAEYNLFCILLFTLMIESNTSPYKARRSTDNQQLTSRIRKYVSTVYAPLDDERTDFSAKGKGWNCSEGICDAANDYPSAHIAKIVSLSPDLPDLIGGIVSGGFITSSSRYGPENPEWNYLCAEKDHYRSPRTMTNSRNKEVYVINDGGKLKQIVNYRTCLKSQDKCAKKVDFPEGVKSQCIQKYTLVRLWALDENGKLMQELFPIPSCCVCGYTYEKTTIDNN